MTRSSLGLFGSLGWFIWFFVLPASLRKQFWFLERLLLPAAGMAASTNLLLVQLGRRHFHAVVPSLDGETASMSRKYLQASVGILLIF